MKRLIIHDGDHGGDDFLATLIFAARPELFEFLGVTVGFGNTSLANAARNASAALDLANRADVQVFPGSNRPLVISPKRGDDAYSANGIGGVTLPFPERSAADIQAVEWMAKILMSSAEPVTLCATGLMTNIAHLLRTYPDVKSKIAGVVAMGGCIGPLGPNARHGNISLYAEFNFYMDPDAAQQVLNSGLPVTLFPLDATHQLTLTPARQALMLERLPEFPARELIRMSRAAEIWDCPKFGLCGPALHDQNVPLYLMAPHLYEGRNVALSINTDEKDERHGQMQVISDNGPVYLIESILDPDAVFTLMLDALADLFNCHPVAQRGDLT